MFSVAIIALTLAGSFGFYGLSTCAHAADVKVGESVFAGPNETFYENQYVMAGQATLSGRVEGDTVAVVGTAIVNGEIFGDLTVIAGTVDVLERVHGDIRIVGGQVTISAPVSGDVVAIGGMIHIRPGATVGGDLIAVGGDIVVEGAINGDARVYGAAVVMDSLVGGAVSIRAGKGVTFGPHAIAMGKVSYRAPYKATVDPSAKLTLDVVFEELDIPARSLGDTGATALFAAAAGAIFLTRLLTGLATSAGFVLIFPGFSYEIVSGAYRNFWAALGVGFAALFVVPAASVFFAVTIVGIFAALILAVLFILILLLASIYSGVLAGALIAKLVTKEYEVSWRWTILGSLGLTFISLIPFVGWLVGFGFFLAALGTITLSVYKRALNGM